MFKMYKIFDFAVSGLENGLVTDGNLIISVQKICYYQFFFLLRTDLNHCQCSSTLKVKGAISVIARIMIVLNRFLNKPTTLSDLPRLLLFKKQAAPQPNTQH